MNNQPKPWDVFYENLFGSHNSNVTFEILSEGFTILLDNANRLIKDSKILKDAGSYMSTSFLSTTAREEMAKSHILIDICRLDFSRHESVLKRLCRAFYNHITKYAYYEVLSFPKLNDMEQVKEMWEIETKKWWPSDFESGEPNMPHHTNYLREMPLYVDYIDWDKAWFNPQDSRGNMFISARLSIFDYAQDELDLFRTTHEKGLYKPECLSILNDIYKKHYMTENTSNQEIDSIYERVGIQIEKELAILKANFTSSFINKWPLYHFV